jgi:hypothetical protein
LKQDDRPDKIIKSNARKSPAGKGVLRYGTPGGVCDVTINQTELKQSEINIIPSVTFFHHNHKYSKHRKEGYKCPVPKMSQVRSVDAIALQYALLPVRMLILQSFIHTQTLEKPLIFM